MLDEETGRLIAERVAPWQEERRRAFWRDAQVVMNDFATRGLGQSSALGDELAHVASKEVQARFRRAWADCQQVLAAAGVAYSDSLRGELRDLVCASVHTGDLTDLPNR